MRNLIEAVADRYELEPFREMAALRTAEQADDSFETYPQLRVADIEEMFASDNPNINKFRKDPTEPVAVIKFDQDFLFRLLLNLNDARATIKHHQSERSFMILKPYLKAAHPEYGNSDCIG